MKTLKTMNLINKFKKKYMESNLVLALFALIVSIGLWLFISLTQYPVVPKTIAHVPLSVDTTENQNGLTFVSSDVQEVTVEILGSRTKIGSFSKDTLTAYFDADSISNIGSKSMPLKIKSANGEKFEVRSVTPTNVNVVYDKIDTREFEVTPLTPNLKTVDGKAIDPSEYECVPSEIRITGPTATLDKISKCCALSTSDLVLASKAVLNCEDIQLFTEDNAIIDQTALKLSNTKIDINVAVRTQKTVKLQVSVLNAPTNFDTDMLKFSLSENYATLATNNSQTEIPNPLNIGLIPLSDIKPGFSTTISLKKSLEGTELINVSELDAITVTLDDSELSELPLTIDKSRIVISNPPDNQNYEYSVLTQQLNITLAGSAESLAQITPDDIVAEVNLLNLNANTDQFYQSVSFSCPAFSDVWVATNSKVSVQRTKIPNEKSTFLR